MHSRLLAVCTVSLLLACPPGVAATKDAGLFSADAEPSAQRPPAPGLFPGNAASEGEGRSGVPGGASPRLEGRSRVAGIDLGRLSAARSDVARGRPHPTRLNLFADADFKAVFERTSPTASGYTLTGRLADDPLSTVVVAVNDGAVAGTVWGVDGIHAIRGTAGGVAIRRMDPGRLARCQGPVPLPSAGRALHRAPQDAGPPSVRGRGALGKEASAADDGATVDLLVIYPTYIRRRQGGHLAMRTLIDHDVAMANAAFDAGGVDVQVVLVAAVEVDYEPQEVVKFGVGYRPVRPRGEYWNRRAVLSALIELQDPSDGHLDDVHALRDSYAADLVLMHWGDREELGLAYRPDSLSSDEWEGRGFAVSASVPFTHELGHNLGLMHDRADNPGNLPFPYSHGYVFDSPAASGPRSHGTIMSVSGEYVHRFSDPNQRFPDAAGVPLGVPGDAPTERADGPADAVRSLGQTRRMVANFRRSADRCEYRLSPEAPVLPAAGGEFKIRVETAPGCAWRARSPDGLAVPLAGTSSGVGGGELAYRLPANGSWEREGVIFVAGEAYRVRQAGARPITPVCERPPSIRRALSRALAKRGCAEFTAADLASVWFLRLDDPEKLDDEELRTLKRGDFDGLSNLHTLYVSNHLFWGRDADGFVDGVVVGLTSLEVGAFEGLSNLNTLSLATNSLRGLEAGTFSGLSNLRDLQLDQNALSALTPGAFEGLPGLRSLNLGRNQLAKLEPGVFAALRNLRNLSLYDNPPLTVLNSGAFSGLSNLLTLYLHENNITTIEPSAFAGMPNLGHLVLIDNNLARLEPGAFGGLRSLHVLRLNGNPLGNLRSGQFQELPGLRRLSLRGVGLQSLTSDVFDGLTELIDLDLAHNRLATLQANFFVGLPDLDTVDLSHNRLTAWDRRLFARRRAWLGLDLSGNRIRALPLGAFEGVKLQSNGVLNLSGNPGSPFVSSPELVRLPRADSAPNRSAGVAVEVAEGALMDMHIGLSVSNGSLSAEEAFIGQGAIRGSAVWVRPNGDGPVAVSVVGVPSLRTAPECPFVISIAPLFCQGFWGVRTAASAPLILWGLPDQALAPDGAVRFDLPTAFPDFPDGTSYTVELSNPAAADATVREGLLILSAADSGETEVTVTATGPDGQREMRRFTVRALASPEAVGGPPELSLAAGDSLRIEVSEWFRDPDGGPLAYAAESTDSAVAAASVDGGAVLVAGGEPGVAKVTVTATDPDGLSAAQTFTVTVNPPSRSFWGGWRSALLRPPPTDSGDDS